jgi:L-threonine-O-3-phosphate decarboxylase
MTLDMTFSLGQGASLEHGGNLPLASRRFNIPVAQWIDLSTGISPWSWPVPAVPQHVWQTLPYADEELETAAARYYGCDRAALLAVPGSQYALQYTPTWLRRGTVAMPLRGYAEHRAAWERAGHQLVEYADGEALQHLVVAGVVDHALVINPNNPTGEVISAQQLLRLHATLRAQDGWLVVDEAFADVTPSISLASRCPTPGLIVYRSAGKFFGLAGLRLGFLLAPPDLSAQLQLAMPPWLLSHPARWVGTAALLDIEWQTQQQARLTHSAAQWLQDLRETVPALVFTGTSLFVSGVGDAAYCEALYDSLGRRAVLLRLFESSEGQRILRFGLPLPETRGKSIHLLREAVEECR